MSLIRLGILAPFRRRPVAFVRQGRADEPQTDHSSGAGGGGRLRARLRRFAPTGGAHPGAGGLGRGRAAAAVVVRAYGAAPLLAARPLVQASKAGGAERLARQVVFPAGRASLKDELNPRMVVEMRKDERLGDSGLSGLGMLLAPAL